MDVEKTVENLIFQSNGILHSFVMLVRVLEKSGSLEKGRFEQALKETFNHPDAQFERADYQFFAQLLQLLEQDRP